MDELLYNFDDEIKPMIFDIIRLLTMQIITQFLISMNSSTSSFFTTEFLQITLFLVLSLDNEAPVVTSSTELHTTWCVLWLRFHQPMETPNSATLPAPSM